MIRNASSNLTGNLFFISCARSWNNYLKVAINRNKSSICFVLFLLSAINIKYLTVRDTKKLQYTIEFLNLYIKLVIYLPVGQSSFALFGPSFTGSFYDHQTPGWTPNITFFSTFSNRNGEFLLELSQPLCRIASLKNRNSLRPLKIGKKCRKCM